MKSFTMFRMTNSSNFFSVEKGEMTIYIFPPICILQEYDHVSNSIADATAVTQRLLWPSSLLFNSKYTAMFIPQWSWNLLNNEFLCIDLVCWFSYYIHHNKIFVAYYGFSWRTHICNIHSGEIIFLILTI